LNEIIGQAVAGGPRSPPGFNEGISVARTLVNELDAARFDPLLAKSVAKGAVSSLEMFLSRMDALVVRDRSSLSIVGPSASAQFVSNAQLTTCLYQCWSRLEKISDDYAENVVETLLPAIDNIRRAYDSLVEPVMTMIRRELGAIIAKLHRMDLGNNLDPDSNIGRSSSYMKDLADKLSFIKSEILSKYNLGESGYAWVTFIVTFVIRTFVLHASIARPLGESGKLQLTNDMTELEFALSSFMAGNPIGKHSGSLEAIGEDYRSLRAMRPLLFLDNGMLASPEHTAGLPPLVVLHHILVRSPLPLPHELHGWQEAEYIRWVDEHTEQEAWTLVESGLAHWEKISESEGTVDVISKEYVELARSVALEVGSGPSYFGATEEDMALVDEN